MVLAIVVFSLISLFLSFILLKSSGSDLAHLNSLWQSNYTYSAVMNKSVGQDDYYQFSAGISFSLSTNVSSSLNADIVMQTIESEYSESVYWNARELSTYGVAISASIAEENGIAVGDKLYSKRVVDSEICEYTVEQILPEISTVRVSEQKNYSNGIIIMGYDRLYTDNISHSVLVFTKEPINELMEDFSDMPQNIIYRDDELVLVSLDIFPYIITFVLLAAIITIGLVMFLTKSITYNFRRLAALGFSKKLLDKAYIRNISGAGLCSIFLVFLVSIVALYREDIYPQIILVLVVLGSEFITLIIANAISLRRLWRR